MNESGNSLGELVRTATHRISQPLTVAWGSCELARARSGPEAQAPLASALREIERMVELVEALRALAAAEQAPSQTLALAAVLAEAWAEMALLAESRHVTWVAAPAELDGVRVRGAPRRLVAALCHLAATAVERAEAGPGRAATARVRVEAAQARIEIEDGGAALDAEEWMRLVDPFAAGAAPRRALPYALARAAIRAAGGELQSVRSPAGNRIVVTLPRVEP